MGRAATDVPLVAGGHRVCSWGRFIAILAQHVHRYPKENTSRVQPKARILGERVPGKTLRGEDCKERPEADSGVNPPVPTPRSPVMSPAAPSVGAEAPLQRPVAEPAGRMRGVCTHGDSSR